MLDNQTLQEIKEIHIRIKNALVKVEEDVLNNNANPMISLDAIDKYIFFVSERIKTSKDEESKQLLVLILGELNKSCLKIRSKLS